MARLGMTAAFDPGWDQYAPSHLSSCSVPLRRDDLSQDANTTGSDLTRSSRSCGAFTISNATLLYWVMNPQGGGKVRCTGWTLLRPMFNVVFHDGGNRHPWPVAQRHVDNQACVLRATFLFPFSCTGQGRPRVASRPGCLGRYEIRRMKVSEVRRRALRVLATYKEVNEVMPHSSSSWL